MSKAKKEKEAKKNNDFLAQEAAEEHAAGETYTLDIPEDEIWTYQIEGLKAPHINKPFKNARRNKIIVVIAILISISFSIFFSVRVVHSDLYTYKELEDGTYELVRFSNNGSIKDLTVDYVVDNETGEKDLTKPVTSIAEFAFNCDETINSITIGEQVNSIAGKAIYSCWWITNVKVDPANPYYCDIDGVLYNKDLTEVIFYPNDHDKYLREKLGYNNLVDDNGEPMEELWGTTEKYDSAFFNEYNKSIRTYVIPSTVTKIGELAFAYTNIVDIYIPEGVKVLDNMAFFKAEPLQHIYSYTTDEAISDTSYLSRDHMSSVYSSLPEGLESIGSDCFYYLRGLDYMYIPSSVKSIGHHAFWDTVYKEDGEIIGISEINVALSEDAFDDVDTGDQWRPIIDNGVFRKPITVNYGQQRSN